MPAQARVSSEFGKAVREMMGALSQSEVALRAQVSVGYVNRIVRGSVPSEAIIRRLADALNADPNPLLTAAGFKPQTFVQPGVSGENEPSARREDGESSSESEVLGPDAAAQYYRAVWDRYVHPLFPDADIPSGAGLPLSRSGIRARVMRVLNELVEEEG